MGVWFAFGIEHPYIYYGVYILSGSLVCGLSGVLGLCCSFLFKSRYLAYFFAFLVWLAQMMLPFGVGHAVQPYVEGGHIYGLVGRNGSGKTMLLRVMCGLVLSDSGTVTVDGRRLHMDIPFPPSCGAVIEDVECVGTVREILARERERGKLTVIASHNREDMELLADRAIYVSDGKFVERRSVSPFK